MELSVEKRFSDIEHNLNTIREKIYKAAVSSGNGSDISDCEVCNG